MNEPIVSPLTPRDCEMLWYLEQERQLRILRDEISKYVQERLYIVQKLKANGIDINDLEEA